MILSILPQLAWLVLVSILFLSILPSAETARFKFDRRLLPRLPKLPKLPARLSLSPAPPRELSSIAEFTAFHHNQSCPFLHPSSSSSSRGGGLLHRLRAPKDPLSSVCVVGNTSALSATHPTIQLVLQRLREGSKPSQRAQGDRERVALCVEGGGMRGCVSAGAAAALSFLGLNDAVDVVYGSSAGALIGAYFVSRQYSGQDIYHDTLPTAGKRFLDKSKILHATNLVPAQLLTAPRRLQSMLRGTSDNLRSLLSRTAEPVPDQGNNNNNSENKVLIIDENEHRLSSAHTHTLSDSHSHSHPHGHTPILNLDFLLNQVISQQFDWETFAHNEEKQPLRIIASNAKTLSSVVLSRERGHFRDLPTLLQCVRASMLVPGVTQPLLAIAASSNCSFFAMHPPSNHGHSAKQKKKRDAHTLRDQSSHSTGHYASNHSTFAESVVSTAIQSAKTLSRMAIGALLLPWRVLLNAKPNKETPSSSNTGGITALAAHLPQEEEKQTIIESEDEDLSGFMENSISDSFESQEVSEIAPRIPSSCPFSSLSLELQEKNESVSSLTDDAYFAASPSATSIETTPSRARRIFNWFRLFRFKGAGNRATNSSSLPHLDHEEDRTLTVTESHLCDALLCEPIPYRSAVQEANHLIVLRTRPDPCRVLGRGPGLYEKFIAKSFFHRYKAEQAIRWMLGQEHLRIYAEDVLHCNEGASGEPLTLFGRTVSLLPLAPQHSEEVQQLETRREYILRGMRSGAQRVLEIFLPLLFENNTVTNNSSSNNATQSAVSVEEVLDILFPLSVLEPKKASNNTQEAFTVVNGLKI